MTASLPELSIILRDVVRDIDVDLTLSTRFEDFPYWDLMDLMSVVAEAERHYALQFQLAEVDRLVTIGDLLDMINGKQALAAA